ncbi:MAG: geranylgeranylglyceryl/heptaprenylglyceryl phosphate synthase [Chitinophagales bacterium]|nr:geranylgeranylglyceryl/heptaprenylglyceryl phosphate synthase [Chitinophagales bacterium]MDW8394207.1 geranylgeranylglyceryl/heptaprenylglyceryl phosphate synthase [Chitinophagales bacterium]
MPTNNLYNGLLQARKQGQKKFAVLIDPDKTDPEHLLRVIQVSRQSETDYFLVGGSMLLSQTLAECVTVIKSLSDIPVILFPGSPLQICDGADALLLLSVISSRNAELLIGQHVTAAPALRASRLEIISTGYLLIDGGTHTTVAYVSQSMPIPAGSIETAVCTAMAGELLGLRSLYLEAGSGARMPVSTALVRGVREHTQVPLFVGGGIRTAEQATELCRAGADVIVAGTATEESTETISTLAAAVHAAAWVH